MLLSFADLSGTTKPAQRDFGVRSGSLAGSDSLRVLASSWGPGPSMALGYTNQAHLSRGFPAATRFELAIRCVLNRLGESMDIQRLCPNFDRRHAR